MPSWSQAALHTRLVLVGALVLVLGLIASLGIFLTATDDATEGMDVQIIDGQVYTMSPDESKRYEDQIERFGGRSAVLADRFDRWWHARWRGTQLAYTLATLSLVVAGLLFWLSRLIATHPHYAGRPAHKDIDTG